MFQVRVLSLEASEQTLQRKVLQQVVANISASHAAVASALCSSTFFLFTTLISMLIHSFCFLCRDSLLSRQLSAFPQKRNLNLSGIYMIK